MTLTVPWLPAANVLLWPMRFWTGFVADLDADELRPIDHIDRLRCPTLLLFGADDAKVGAHAAEDLLARSGAADKRLITIPGAHHQDLFAFDRERVTAALQSFVPGAR